MSTATRPQPTPGLLTYSEAGRVLGIDRKMVGLLAGRIGITPRPVPWNGNAKGLDLDGLLRLKGAWEGLRPADPPDG